MAMLYDDYIKLRDGNEDDVKEICEKYGMDFRKERMFRLNLSGNACDTTLRRCSKYMNLDMYDRKID